jgi:2-aminoadipate transaminase
MTYSALDRSSVSILSPEALRWSLSSAVQRYSGQGVKLAQLNPGADLHTSTFAEVVAHEVARGNCLDEHVQKIQNACRERRDVMLEALQEYFPSEVTCTRPEGGLFLWVTLPPEMDSRALFHEALKQNVAFVPGDSFFPPNGPREGGSRYFRLNFSSARPEQIREGIRQLSAATKAHLQQFRIAHRN